MQNLALVSLEDLQAFVTKESIKNEVWGTSEAASFLDCSETQLLKLAKNGTVPGIKLGAEWKFSSIKLFELVYGEELHKTKGGKQWIYTK